MKGEEVSVYYLNLLHIFNAFDAISYTLLRDFNDVQIIWRFISGWPYVNQSIVIYFISLSMPIFFMHFYCVLETAKKGDYFSNGFFSINLRLYKTKKRELKDYFALCGFYFIAYRYTDLILIIVIVFYSSQIVVHLINNVSILQVLSLANGWRKELNGIFSIYITHI